MTLFCISLSFFSWNNVLLCEIIWRTLSQRYYLCFFDSAGLAVKMWLIRVDGGRGDYAFTLGQIGNKYIIVLHILYLLWLSLFSSKLFDLKFFSVTNMQKRYSSKIQQKYTVVQLWGVRERDRGQVQKTNCWRENNCVNDMRWWYINPSWVGVVERKCSVHLGKSPCSLSL